MLNLYIRACASGKNGTFGENYIDMASSVESVARHNKWIAAIIFVVAVAIIVLFLPKQRQFRYELQKGKAWQHEDLYAPFDFVVLKTDAEIKEERENNYKNAKPYFNVLSEVYPEQKIRFEQEFDHRFAVALEAMLVKYPQADINPDTLKTHIYNFAANCLSFMYSKGITSYSDIIEKSDNQALVVLVEDKVSRVVPATEIFTVRSAQEFVSRQINMTFQSSLTSLATADGFNMYDFIKPNIEYDKTTTAKAREQLGQQLSTSHGMVRAGQLIIARNELMNDSNLRILESLRREYQNYGVATSTISWITVGQSLIIIILLTLLYLYIYFYNIEIFGQVRRLILLIGMIVTIIIMMCVLVRLQIGNTLVLPIVILPIIIKTFYNGRLAFFAHIITILICGLMSANGFQFIFLQAIAGTVAVFTLMRITKLRQLMGAVLLVALAYILAYTALSLLQEGQLSTISLRPYMWLIINGLFLFLCYPLIFLIEKIFGFVSDVTLLELADTNNPLLRELAEKAPCTFQHVMQVANLAEDASRNIGGNPLLTRVGALYHDIGKTIAPQYFTENQVGINPHDQLQPEQSAEIIISHVTNGVTLAKEHKLPPRVVDFIETHHGTDLVRYFYNKAVEQNGQENTDIAKFRYPGPLPSTKETAILMLADSIEAASRTLKDYSSKTIDELVERIFNDKIENGQMNHAKITFNDINTIKETFKQKLQNIYHTRVAYPDQKKKTKKGGL